MKAELKMVMRFEIYKDSAGEYRWKLKAGNNKIVAVSGEGYKKKQSVVKIIEKIKAAVVTEGEASFDDTDIGLD